MDEFIVDEYGTLHMKGVVEPTTRAGFYDFIAKTWRKSPEALIDAMNECEPLAWAVHSLYSESRQALHERVQVTADPELQARLDDLPEDPEEGAAHWLLNLSLSEFKKLVVPDIKKWFDAKPNWNWEQDHLPLEATAQGAAKAYFENLSIDDLDLLGVEIVEGDHPGSTYYAAELRTDIRKANKAAKDADIPVHFSRR